MIVNKRLLILLAVFSFSFYVSVPVSYAMTIHAASVSFSDVASAVSMASSGDTVAVPAGTVTWNITLSISKGITLQGAGIGNTVIKSGLMNIDLALIKYEPASPALNESFRVSGFTFDGEWAGRGVWINNNTTHLITNVRIDNNRFVDCNSRGVLFWGFVYGLVDHNEFKDCYKSCDVYGKEWDSWELLPLNLGTTDTVVIEDNYIYHTGTRACSGITSAGQGGRYTFRYNEINTPCDFDLLDAHGNQKPVTEDYRNQSRGTVTVEIYNNEIYSTRGSHRLAGLRGGTCIMFGNRMTGTSTHVIITMTEEDDWNYGYVSAPPAYDPIMDTYIWDNTLRGNTITPELLKPEEDAAYIQEGRDYWLFEPGGYTPLEYPHPMANTGGTSPIPPVNLRVTD